jgi:alpha-L-fucosidase
MWDTAVIDYNVVKATPWHHDPMKDLSEACKEAGIKFAFYHSIMDWHHPELAGYWNADKDAAKTRRALKKARYRATERSMLEVRLKDKPGAVAKAAQRFAKAKVNIASGYVLAPGRGNVTIAFGVKDARAAKKALGR